MKALMSMSFILAIGTAVLNQFNLFSLILVGVTGVGVAYQFRAKEA